MRGSYTELFTSTMSFNFMVMLAGAVSILAPASVSANQWEEVGLVRATASMVPLVYSEVLSVAAGNHAAYLTQNLPLARRTNISAHGESSSLPLFTGVSASDRALYAGYVHQQVTENISTGNDTARDSVRNLMSAIYHRFGFLSFDIDSIGIANQSKRYVYNMGRRDLEMTCSNPPAQALLQSRVSCHGVKMRGEAYESLCQNIPPIAQFEPPYSKQCPDGTRLKQSFVSALCLSPPAEAIHRGAGRYYHLCDNEIKIKADWFEALCATPPVEAAYQQSGSYYQICKGADYGHDEQMGIKVHADWYTAYCANLTLKQRYSDSGKFFRPCVADIRVRAEYMSELDQQIQQQNPAFVLWPAPDSQDIPPVFFEENPDPLPDLSVSGYPVSLQFNPAYVASANIVQFSMERYISDSSGGVPYWQNVPNIRFIDAQNDPNHKFSPLQFAWFPLTRLGWNTPYRVSISALVDGASQQFYSEFQTEDLGIPVLDVYPDTELISVQDRAWVALYQAPSDIEPTPFKNVKFNYPGGSNVELELIDVQTTRLRVSDARCRPVTLTLHSGRRIKVETCR